MLVLKKNGSIEEWKSEKINGAILLANKRTEENITQLELERLSSIVKDEANALNKDTIKISEIHELVMKVLKNEGYEDTFNQYSSYRNYKQIFSKNFVEGYNDANRIMSAGDNENANKDSTLNSTKQVLIAAGTMRNYMKNFVMRKEWIDAHNSKMIHIHDLSERFLNSSNCCLFRMDNVLKDGFELNGIKYNEPGGVQKAFDVAGDVVLSASAQQYGK